MPRVLTVNSESPETEIINRAIKVIQAGGLIVFPTDTIYGLGANALNPQSVLKVYKAKKRQLDRALPLIVSGLEMAEILAFVTKKAKKLIQVFWPGALTIILKKKPIVPSIVAGGKLSIGIRAPNHSVPLMICKRLGLPLTGTSANKHGGQNPVVVKEVLNQLKEGIDLVLDGGRAKTGIGSTVINLTRNPPLILREGSIIKETIEKTIGCVDN